MARFKCVVRVKLCSQELPRSNASQYAIIPCSRHKRKYVAQSRNTLWKRKANIWCLFSLPFIVGGKFWLSKHTLTTNSRGRTERKRWHSCRLSLWNAINCKVTFFFCVSKYTTSSSNTDQKRVVLISDWASSPSQRLINLSGVCGFWNSHPSYAWVNLEVTNLFFFLSLWRK